MSKLITNDNYEEYYINEDEAVSLNDIQEDNLKTNDKDLYVRTYFNNFVKFSVMSDLTKTDFIILSEMINELNYINFDAPFCGNTISYSTALRTNMLKRNGIDRKTFYNTVKKLIDGNVLRRIDGYKGLYQVNPFIFAKGGDSDVSRFRNVCLKNNWFKNICLKNNKKNAKK